MSPTQVEQYFSAARKIVAELLKQKATRPDLYERAFGPQPSSPGDQRATARVAAERFATRAFRRPVDTSYIDQLMLLYDKAREKHQSHEIATGHLLTAVLISPRFLLRVEQNKTGVEDAYPVDDYELATRLSYFLWSRPPDDKLLQLAAAGYAVAGRDA